MKTIIVATDFSERSDRALRRATLLAREFDARIILINVIDDDQPQRIINSERDEAAELLHQTAATLHSVDGIECDVEVILASPFVGVVNTAAKMVPDLLVIGPHRRQFLRDVFIGTTAERTIRSVSCPVLMVNGLPSGYYQHTMLTTDLSDYSREALQRFYSLGISRSVKQTLLYVFDAPALRLGFSHSLGKEEQQIYLADQRQDASRELSRFITAANIGNVIPMLRHESSAAQHEILKAVEEEKADLIVMSTHGRGGLPKALIGSTTEQMLRKSTVDVLAIPPLQRA